LNLTFIKFDEYEKTKTIANKK